MRRGGKYRHIKPLPGPPVANHEQWVCCGCGKIEWFARSCAPMIDKRWHCATYVNGCWQGTDCWQPIVNLSLLGLSVDVVLAAAKIGGPDAVKAMCDEAARARDIGGLREEMAVVPGMGVL